MRQINRRDFLRTTCAAGVSAGFAGTMGDFAARAAATGGYRALVCLFFKGGLDCHDTVLPYDTASYADYEAVRRPLIQRYDAGASRARTALLELSPANAAELGGRAFALPPNMAGLHDLFQTGRASILANVGPLIEPMTRTQFRDRSRTRPSKLFSHNDQQSTWMSLNPEGERFGWGGRFADAALASNANQTPVFTAMSVSGNDVFLAGERAIQYQVGTNGADSIRELVNAGFLGTARNSEIARAALADHYRGVGPEPLSLMARDVATVNRRAVDANALYTNAIEAALPLATTFPETRVGRQLARIASTINSRGALGVNRQVFFASTGGFDTHSGQANSLPDLQSEFSDAIAAFQSAMDEIGISNDVTLVTMSDFGRTFVVNGDGTDHGWGAHHFIVGGAVNGGRIFGTMPPATVGHDQDSNNGRLIPTTSVEQFAAPLGRWFGLTEAELSAALPSLRNFSAPPLVI